MTRRRRLGTRRTAGVLVFLVVATACGGDERPSEAAWRATWDERVAAMPDADELRAGGSELCGELVGRFRDELPALLPTPDEVLDAAVEDWAAHAETIVFECPHDPEELDERYDALELLAAEVEAGLAVDLTD